MDDAVVVLTGRPGRFSGGFDLRAMDAPDEAFAMVRGGFELCRYRLTRRDTVKALVTAHVYSPADAVRAAYLDEVVPPERLAERAREIAAGLIALDAGAHTATKQRVHEPALKALRTAIESEFPPGRTLD